MGRGIWILGLLLASGCNLQLKPVTDPFYEAVLTENPENPAALYAQGETLIRQGRFKDASRYFQRLVKAAPGESKAWFGWGRCLYELRQYKESQKAFSQALALHPSRAAYLGLASATLMSGQIEAARGLARQLEAQYGPSAALARLQGDIAFVTGDYPAALRAYRASYKKDPAQSGLQSKIRDLEDFLASSAR